MSTLSLTGQQDRIGALAFVDARRTREEGRDDSAISEGREEKEREGGKVMGEEQSQRQELRGTEGYANDICTRLHSVRHVYNKHQGLG